ncbi:protein translocase subunit SecD [Sodalis sp. CWE]|uniref:protein translocase subunit SecD n=1 Tax=Sodalis sp. CWE TaxID=2803816 RepID=UPI001C7E0909|nr:protein translocase subunit SecD [Sodalis sp. CWE]
MLNHYPLWKNIALVLSLVVSTLYALPNLYGEDLSIQVINLQGNSANESVLTQVRKVLEQESIPSKSIAIENKTIIARFTNSNAQFHAQEVLIKVLGENYVAALNLTPAVPNWLTKFGASPMKLGLDLRGGIYFLIEVDTNPAVEKLQEQIIETLRLELHDNAISYEAILKKANYENEIQFNNTKNRNQAALWLVSRYNDITVNNYGKYTVRIAPTSDRQRQARESAVLQNINILRNRINQLGISEPLVQRHGFNHIAIELPGIQDIALAKKILGATATLEFRLVNNDLNLDTIFSRNLPENLEIKMTSDGKPIVLYKKVILTGEHIIDAVSSTDAYNRPQVNILLDDIGGLTMFHFTKDNIGKLMATLFVEYKDGGRKNPNGRPILIKKEEIINIATIQSRFGNNFRVTGINSLSEARLLSLLLKAGTLTTPIQIVEERTIGPTLGSKNITRGLKACFSGLITSILFMVIWYKKSGLIAAAALIVNLILIIAIMSLLPGATLTMPGIAGIILALAVSVDANVLINERIKEELCSGRQVQQAIHEGYRCALPSIIDANLTTLITTIILYCLGTGPIKGFAITTSIGTITSMLTVIIGTRAITNLLYGGKNIDNFSI